MLSIVKKITPIFLGAVISLSAQGQNINLTDDQYFKSDFKNVIQPLPLAGNWIDDSHIILTKAGKAVVLNCKTGIERAATDEDYGSNTAAKTTTYIKSGNIFIKVNNVETQLTTDTAKKNKPHTKP